MGRIRDLVRLSRFRDLARLDAGSETYRLGRFKDLEVWPVLEVRAVYRPS